MLAGVKEELAAAGRGARRRGTLLSILGLRVGKVVAGCGGAVAWGLPEKNLGTGGLEAAHRLPRAAGATVWPVVSVD